MSFDELFEVHLHDGARVAFAARGAGPVNLLLLHGIPGWSGCWARVAERLPRDVRVLAPDLAGFGRSSSTRDIRRLHTLGQAETLLEALDRIGVSKAAIVGHDFGGPTALWMTRLCSGLVTHLGLASMNTFHDTPVPFPLNMLNVPVLGRAVERMLMSQGGLRMMLRQGVGTPPVWLSAAEYVGPPEQATAIREIFAASLRDLAGLYTPVEEALHQVHVPAFVAWGTRDPFFAVAQGQRLADAIPGAVFELLPGAGHFLPEERASDLARLITRTIGTHAPIEQVRQSRAF